MLGYVGILPTQDAFSRINGAHEIHENGAHVEICSGTGKHGFLRQREVACNRIGNRKTLFSSHKYNFIILR